MCVVPSVRYRAARHDNGGQMRTLLTLCVSFAIVLSACSGDSETEPAADEAIADDVVDELEVRDDAADDLDEMLRIKGELDEANDRFVSLHAASLRGPSERGCRYEETRTMDAIDRLDVGLPSAEFRMALDEMRVAAALLATDCTLGAGIGDPQRWLDAASQAALSLEELIIDAGG